MRLFLAVDLDRRVQDAAAAVAAPIRREIERAGRRLAPAGASWVASANLHVTLRFLGEVEEGRLPLLAGVLAVPFSQPPFMLELSGLGLFPPSGRPRLMWIGTGRGHEELMAIHAELERRLETLGFPPEGRSFRAHVTIARFREAAATEVRGLVDRLSRPIGACPIEEVVLYQSQLSSAGPTYTPLARGRLGGER